MNTLTKTLVGAALLAGSVLTVSAPASAQPAYRGDGVYGRQYDGNGSGAIRRDTRHCTSPRLGQWRYNTLTNRRVFVPYRWAVRGGYLRDCMYAQSRPGGVWYRY